MTACPEQPDDWSAWTATVTCPRRDGSLVAGMTYSGVEAAVTFGCLLLSALFILIPWDGVRLYALSGPAASSLVPTRTAPP